MGLLKYKAASFLIREGCSGIGRRQVSWLVMKAHHLQLRHSAGLAPASTFTPWHPGIGLPLPFQFSKCTLNIPHCRWDVNAFLCCCQFPS